MKIISAKIVKVYHLTRIKIHNLKRLIISPGLIKLLYLQYYFLYLGCISGCESC